MSLLYRSVILSGFALAAMIGCGGGTESKTTPQGPACTGTLFTGTLQDSLTFQPVPQAQVLLESGSPELTSFIYSFSPTAQATSAADGTFHLCAASLPSLPVLVITALDPTGKAYPPYATNRFASSSLGSIYMGSCVIKCIDAQQQSNLPVTIAGTVTTDPVAEIGTVLPQQAVIGLDGSRNIWSLTIPPLNPTQSLTFQTGTTAGSPCAGQSSPCAAYSFVLPTEQPVIATAEATSQLAAGAGYSITAQVAAKSTTSTSACTPSFAFTARQEDGTTSLFAAPGAQLTAAPLRFQACQ